MVSYDSGRHALQREGEEIRTETDNFAVPVVQVLEVTRLLAGCCERCVPELCCAAPERAWVAP